LADQYLVVAGFAQKFPSKPLLNTREANGTTVTDVTVKALGSQKLVRISIWGEFGDVAKAITENSFIAAEGKYSVSGGDNGRQFHNLSASKVAIDGKSLKKAAREVVNQNDDASGDAGDADTQTNPF
jgi:hypothetical protein